MSRAQMDTLREHGEDPWAPLSFPKRDRACEGNQYALTGLCPHLYYSDEMRFD